MTIRISADQARRLVLQLQGLAAPPRRRLTPSGLLELIERLGFVQVDSINTVARAHHMILFARNETYRPALLKRLLEDERALFEHWTDRIASLLPIRFYPYWRTRFARERAMVEELYRAGIDRSKVSHWVAAHDLVSTYVPAATGSKWRSDARAMALPADESDPKAWIDLVCDDEFPLSMFYLQLQGKLQAVPA